MSERERRELAEAHRDDAPLETVGPVEPRRLGQMVSLRFEPDILARLREIANSRGSTVSDLLREGAALVIASNEQAMQITRISLNVEVQPTETRARLWGASAGEYTGNPSRHPEWDSDELYSGVFTTA